MLVTQPGYLTRETRARWLHVLFPFYEGSWLSLHIRSLLRSLRIYSSLTTENEESTLTLTLTLGTLSLTLLHPSI